MCSSSVQLLLLFGGLKICVGVKGSAVFERRMIVQNFYNELFATLHEWNTHIEIRQKKIK